ncbi:hypothetical protein KIPB_009200 [Kipferlia bialata]|uniref:Uncharacterized protein n=1 Tax=Kipferlia bialata TaxID=797122 RepID=A0A9K3D3L0_9EUKA|nr:hypothetical protein KIPB_009200 [Kipferlia bialata]|eukprot:g9200.t1
MQETSLSDAERAQLSLVFPPLPDSQREREKDRSKRRPYGLVRRVTSPKGTLYETPDGQRFNKQHHAYRHLHGHAAPRASPARERGGSANGRQSVHQSKIVLPPSPPSLMGALQLFLGEETGAALPAPICAGVSRHTPSLLRNPGLLPTVPPSDFWSKVLGDDAEIEDGQTQTVVSTLAIERDRKRVAAHAAREAERERERKRARESGGVSAQPFTPSTPVRGGSVGRYGGSVLSSPAVAFNTPLNMSPSPHGDRTSHRNAMLPPRPSTVAHSHHLSRSRGEAQRNRYTPSPGGTGLPPRLPRVHRTLSLSLSSAFSEAQRKKVGLPCDLALVPPPLSASASASGSLGPSAKRQSPARSMPVSGSVGVPVSTPATVTHTGTVSLPISLLPVPVPHPAPPQPTTGTDAEPPYPTDVGVLSQPSQPSTSMSGSVMSDSQD